MKPPGTDFVRLLQIGEAVMVANDKRPERLEMLADEMARHDLRRDSPLRSVPARLGDNWSPLLLKVLETGTYRHATLMRVISSLAHEEKITQRMLTLRLRSLEQDGFVQREVHDTNPPRVEYRLTVLGRKLAGQVTALQNWIDSHEAEILTAREAFRVADGKI